MADFINEHWRAILVHNSLADFEALWRHKAEWFEEPNHRRGGWSGVSRCELELPDSEGGGRRAIFLKRQENHKARLWTHPLRGAPTFLREFHRIQYYRAHGIPTLEPVYFAMRKVGRDERAILITEELTSFVSMEECAQRWLKLGAPERSERLRILEAVATLLRDMHVHHIRHNCFFPKHVLVRANSDGSVEARVIDLEKSRLHPFKTACAIRDLYSLASKSQMWSRSDRLWFFKSYLRIERLTPYAKWLWRAVAERVIRKGRIAPAMTFITTRASVTE
ncbi:MAG: lipopolysaccharide kinase InaA family protein [Betaproteobacteria bacterium]|nr:lipopolysaccharide kinase InaA family protein [Betaproteobacteria bacterium]